MEIETYIETQFRIQFPNAEIDVRVNDEILDVRVDNDHFHFECGSDDDDYLFVCDKTHARVHIPLMPE